MFKSVVSVGLAACVALSGVAVANPVVYSNVNATVGEGITASGPITNTFIDFSKCKVFDGAGNDITATVDHCVKGLQFTVSFRTGNGGVMTTFVKDGNKAIMSETRWGDEYMLSRGLPVGTVATLPLKK